MILRLSLRQLNQQQWHQTVLFTTHFFVQTQFMSRYIKFKTVLSFSGLVIQFFSGCYWTEPIPECYGADIVFRNEPYYTLEDCQNGCEATDGCQFITFGGRRCIFKNGLTSAYKCTGCNSDGTCGNSGDCNPDNEYCSTNYICGSGN